jgi:hypothetical protein
MCLSTPFFIFKNTKKKKNKKEEEALRPRGDWLKSAAEM